MEGPDKNNYDVLSFDCYGTLIDWSRGINDYLIPVFLNHDAHVIDSWVLDFFAEVEPEIQAGGGSYREVLTEVVNRFATRLGFTPTAEELAGFADSVGSWPPFADSRAALERLDEAFDLVVISNVDRDLFDATQTSLGVEFAHVITAGEIGAYKPDLKMFEAARDAIGADARQLHVAQSRFHDIAPAGSMELDTVWINRGAADATQASDAKPTWTFSTLGEFADAILGA